VSRREPDSRGVGNRPKRGTVSEEPTANSESGRSASKEACRGASAAEDIDAVFGGGGRVFEGVPLGL
jgi:hypothetical protein